MAESNDYGNIIAHARDYYGSSASIQTVVQVVRPVSLSADVISSQFAESSTSVDTEETMRLVGGIVAYLSAVSTSFI